MRHLYSLCFFPILAFFCSTTPASACGYNWVGECSTSIHLRINGTTDSFSIAACPSGHQFNGLKLGSLQSLSLANAKAITWESCQNNVTAVSLRYRVYPLSATPGPFLSLDLSEDYSTLQGSYTTRYRSQTSNVDLASGLTVGETYVLEVYFWAAVDTIGDDFVPETFFTQDNGGQNYRMTFVYGGSNAPTFTAAVTESVGPKCAGDQNGAITIGVWGDLTGIHYDWSNVVLNFPQQVGLAAGTYTVTVTGSSHMEIISTTLSPSTDPSTYLSDLPSQILVTCNEPAVTLCATDAPNVSYQWKKDGLVGPATPCIIATAGGVYTLAVSESGCTASATILSDEYKVNPLASATGTASYVLNCFEVDSTIIEYHVGTNAANPTYEWYWQGQLISTESTLTLRLPGWAVANPSVKVSDQFGCSVTVNSVVNVSPPPMPPIISANGTFDLCQPGLIKVDIQVLGGGGSPFSLTWNGQPLQGNQVWAQPGTYTVVATNGNGCSVAQAVTVYPKFSIQVQHAYFPNFNNGGISFNAPGNLSFQWADGSTSSYRFGLAPGTYCVSISQWNSPCTLDTCIVVLGPSSVADLSEGRALHISPNPAQAGGWSTVKPSEAVWPENAEAILYDMSGRAVWRHPVQMTPDGFRVNWPSELPQGQYSLHFLSEGRVVVGKILLHK
jgi:hypothetical protein